MRMHRAAALLLLVWLTGCASGRVVRLETGRGPPVVFTPHSGEAGPVEVERREFKESVAQLARQIRLSANPQRDAQNLLGVEARSGTYLVNPRTRRMTPMEGAALDSDMPPAAVELTRAYLRWCEHTGREGDCLRLLVDSPILTGDGRYALAMALAQGVVLEEMLDAFKGMANPHAALSAALWTMTLYLVLWTVPEPVSKGLAAVMTATAIVYLGVDTFWTLIEGFKRLVEEADRATTFDELRDAGERYGKVMGRNAARAFVLLATVAVGNTAAGFASKVPTLPGSAQAAALAGGRAGLRLAAVGEVGAVAVSGETVTVALAPNAVSMTAQATGGTAAAPVDAEGHDHHIATNKWWKSTNNEGPWSPQFQKIFDKAGMSLDDPANIVHVKGHEGPHPLAYHQQIFRRLTDATEGCRTMARCREALTAELARLGQQIATSGTRLNKLVTGT
ncbi:AHH domain-containing protein [Stigmatella sp. ncwal1]|uniref:AHH domain-containing protein n=1 Tax=Stigmatella ashevillensis TaxID=2995309 RepID=A0ABT5D7V7_9BACT|nr:AHH domain-containing protein [Stigmatella ashevillena]MDC0709145.1 AHH domain-containing protein [Stigmatella ashevillena]